MAGRAVYLRTLRPVPSAGPHVLDHVLDGVYDHVVVDGAAFSPLSLFRNSEQGAWYDPSDFSSMFQDSAGTTPVTAVEQPVGLILDKRLGLALGAEIITNGDFSDGTTGWVFEAGWEVSGGAATKTSGIQNAIYRNTESYIGGRTYIVELDVISIDAGGVSYVGLGDASASFTTTGHKKAYLKPSADTSLIYFAGQVNATLTAIDNISVREIAGNHASQATAAARPVVSARVNLLRYTEDLSNGVWEDVSSGVTAKTYGQTDPLGGTTAVKLVGNHANTWFAQNIGAVQAADYTLSMWIRADAPVTLDMLFSYGANDQVSVNVTTAWQRFSITAARAATAGLFAGLNVGNGNNIYVWHPQLEIGSTATTYQRVTTASDYDTVGFPHYLVFDGIDDCLTTAAIDFTGTSKATQFIGRHSAGSTTQMVYELGPNVQNMFGQLIDGGSVTYAYARGDSGFAFPYAVADTKINQIVTQATDVTSATSIGASTVRINGAAQTLVDGGTAPGGGTLGNLALYIGSRTGSTLFFNGRMYGLVIRGAESSATEIENTEAYIASKAGVTL